MLDQPTLGKPVVHSTMPDPDTEQTWHGVSFKTWVSNERMLADKQARRNDGKELHSTTCRARHMAIPAEQ